MEEGPDGKYENARVANSLGREVVIDCVKASSTRPKPS